MILYQIIIKEWRELFRNKIASWLLGILLILSAFTLWNTSLKFKRVTSERKEAIEHMREKFTGQGAVNPHSAAHYGHYVYKPLNLLGIIDEGVNPYTGISLRLEAHQQHEAMFSPSQSSSSMIRFGELRLSLLLQILLPLFILFVCHNAISGEKEKDTLKLSLAQGIRLRQLVWGKIWAYSLLWCTVLLVNIAIAWLLAGFILRENFNAARLACLFALYGMYYFILTCLAVYISARSRNSANALLTLLWAWLVCTVLLPKATANIGENATPMFTRLEMERRINEDNKNGINGHDPRNERTQRFKDSVMKKYGVDSVNKLPVNLDGLTMQADEEYHNVVYDRHLGAVQENIRQQNKITAASSFINPFAAIRNLSKGLAGTDVDHHFDFTYKAENYRRFIIKTLNDEMAYGGSKTDDWDWTVHADYWHKIQDFRYAPPSAGWAVKKHYTELFAILLWLLSTAGIVHFSSNRLNIL
jgi:ABC-2 type transport system permease protein